jgi:TP901 family phage tail tape measure protein
LSQHQQRLRQQTEQANRELQQQQDRLRQLAERQRQLNQVRQQYQQGRQLQSDMAGFGANSIAKAGVTLYSEAKLIQPSINFESAMSKVQALSRLDKNDAQLAELKKQARQLGASTSFTATDAAQGQSFLAMAGFTPDAIKAAMPSMLDVALAGDIGLAETADIASNILSGFKLEASQMVRVSDSLVGTFTRSNTNLQMLGETMKYVAPVAAGLGIDIETTAAMAGKLGDAGIQGSNSGTALRAIFSRLSAPPKMAREALEQLKVKTADAKGNLRPIVDILADLENATKNLGNTEKQGLLSKIAGLEASSSLLVLVDQANRRTATGTSILDGFVKTVKSANGEASKVAVTMNDNLGGALTTLSSSWEEVRIAIGESVGGELKALVKNITDITTGIGEWVKENPVLAATIFKTIAGLAILMGVLGAISLTLATVLGPMVLLRFMMGYLGMSGFSLIGVFKSLWTALRVVGFAVMGLGRILLTNPIVLAITAIAVAALLIYKYWQPIKDVWDKWLVQPLSRAIEWIANLPSKFMTMGSQIIDGLWQGISAKWEAVKAKVAEIGNSISSTVKEKLGIKSPSRVFAEIGLHTMTGLEQGLAQNQNAPLNTVMGLTKQLKQTATGIMLGSAITTATAAPLDTRPPLAARTAMTASNDSYTYQITINASAGMDEKKLADLVMQQIKQNERQKQSRQRSSLLDID